jgi:hypothetical protein
MMLKERLESAGFIIDDLLQSLRAGTIRAPLQVCRSVQGEIALLTMPDGCYFEGVTYWVDGIPFLIDKEVAVEWAIFEGR